MTTTSTDPTTTAPAPAPAGPAPSRKRRAALIAGLLLVPVLAGLGYWLHWSFVEYRFQTIEDGKAYQSSLMPPEALVLVVKEHKIKTVVDFRRDKDDGAVDEEAAALSAAGVRHIHLPSGQVPTPETVDAFLAVMEDPANQPVLYHCYHGTGRAEVFGAIYRMEFLGWTNEAARAATRWFPELSSFSRDSRKGRFLSGYQKRRGASKPVATPAAP